MRKLYLLSFFFLFVIPSFTYAQTISGTVIDDNTQETLIGVNILLDASGGTSTNIDGAYSLSTTPGEHSLLFKFIGYKDIHKTISVSSGENITINVRMIDAAMELGTVVVSAGKFEQRIEETTVSMEVIKPSLIENKNTTNIQTAMEQVPGVTITDGQANIRGGSGWSYGTGTRVQVLVDDMPLISGDAGQAQWSLIPTENISQVEIIKGASSALYGSSALNGVINIRTAYPGTEPETKVNIHYGFIDDAKRESLNWWGARNQKTYGADFLDKRKIGNLDLVVGGYLLKDEGYRYEEIIDRKKLNFNTRYKNQRIEGLSYGVNGNFMYNTTGSSIIWQSYEHGYIPLDSAVTTTGGNVYNVDPYITFVNKNNNDKHSLRSRYMYVINDNSTQGNDSGQDNQSETYYAEYQFQKNLEQYHLNWTSGAVAELVFAEAELFGGKHEKQTTAIYTQIDKKFGEKLNFSTGARYEQYSLADLDLTAINLGEMAKISIGRPVYRAGLNYQLAEATFLRSSWGQGFRFPSIAELFIKTNLGAVYAYPNEDLRPEDGWSSEIAIKQGIKFGEWKGFIDIAAFQMLYNDMMEFSFGPWGEEPSASNLFGLGFKSINIGKTRIRGIETTLAGQGKLNRNTTLNILAGYLYNEPLALEPEKTYSEGTYSNYYESSSSNWDMSVGLEGELREMPEDHKQVLKYRSRHQVKFNAELQTKHFNTGLSMRYNSFMENMDAIFATPFFATQVPGIALSRDSLNKGDFLIDFRFGKQIDESTNLSVIINNVLNREYQSRPANLMPPRTFSIRYSVKV